MHHFDWQTRSVSVFLLAYLLLAPQLVYQISMGQGNELAWLYLGLLTGWLLLGALAGILLKNRPRMLFQLCHILVNVFFLPMSFFAAGNSAGIASLAGIAYVMLLVMLVPRWIGLAAVIAGIVLSVVHKHVLLSTSSELTVRETLWYSVAYAGLALVAFLWRLLVQKLAETLTQASGVSQNLISSAELELLQRHNRLLKQEMAQHIVEMRKLTATFKPT